MVKAMKKIKLLAIMLSITTPSLATVNNPPLILDRVSFQISARQWVSTQSAKLSVSINMTLNTADLVKARNDIMEKLNKIAKGEWHLVEFNRSQDNSGLETLFVNATVRLNQSALTDIYANAKKVSAPGAQYQISGVEFSPSLEETQATRAKIRDELYKKVNAEIQLLNKTYPNQNYSLSQLSFTEGENAPIAPVGYKNKAVTAMAADGGAAVNLSTELIMTAIVDAASNR